MNLRACLFDLDGVVVDTARFHYLAWKNLADKLGFIFTETDNERLKGISRMESLRILLEIGKITLTEEEKLRVADEKNRLYLSYVMQMTREDILPGVESFLTGLRDAGILIGLGSASKNAPAILQRIELAPLFDVIVDGSMIEMAKPHPEVFAKGAALLGVDAETCIVFEDAVAGVEAAHNAGMKCIGVGAAETLKHADMVIPGFVNFRLSDIPWYASHGYDPTIPTSK